MFIKPRQTLLEIKNLFSLQVILLSFISIFLVLITCGMIFGCIKFMKKKKMNKRRKNTCCSDDNEIKTGDVDSEYDEGCC